MLRRDAQLGPAPLVMHVTRRCAVRKTSTLEDPQPSDQARAKVSTWSGDFHYHHVARIALGHLRAHDRPKH